MTAKAYNRAWRAKNKAWSRSYQNSRRKANREFLGRIKASNGCRFCPEDDPRCLDFHHRDPKKKVLALATAAQNSWSQERMKAEVAKCHVVCANCHRKKHSRSK